jgi:hypothetical protein
MAGAGNFFHGFSAIAALSFQFKELRVALKPWPQSEAT